WQVYLHKTVISAEQMLVKSLHRAKQPSLEGQELFATPFLKHFLTTRITNEALETSPKHLAAFVELDDVDILASIKVWTNHPDMTLSLLCDRLMNRQLNNVEMSNNKPDEELLLKLRKAAV